MAGILLNPNCGRCHNVGWEYFFPGLLTPYDLEHIKMRLQNFAIASQPCISTPSSTSLFHPALPFRQYPVPRSYPRWSSSAFVGVLVPAANRISFGLEYTARSSNHIGPIPSPWRPHGRLLHHPVKSDCSSFTRFLCWRYVYIRPAYHHFHPIIKYIRRAFARHGAYRREQGRRRQFFGGIVHWCMQDKWFSVVPWLTSTRRPIFRSS